MFSSKICVLFCVLLRFANAAPPNIIMILADDMGFNDVSFHGSNQILTPNIDALAYNGVILNDHYVLPTCTPSRSALLTGKYPIHLGMQGYPISTMEPRSLPPGKLLPEYLKDLGYTTRMVGKWHAGMQRTNDTPTFRGFDSHLGYLSGAMSYYDHVQLETVDGNDYAGFVMVRNLEPAWDLQGQYATDVFTEEAVNVIKKHDSTSPLFLMLNHLAPHAGNTGKLLEAPQETINKFSHIVNPNRRTYAAMISKIDDSVGEVVAALQSKGMLENSIIVFLSDNGAPTIGEYPNWGSNWPLRGLKETLWEGGVRGVACVWSSMMQQTPRISADLIHVSDWLPTLYSAAGGDVSILDPEIDGIDQWPSLAYNFPSPRSEVLINIDEKEKNAALRYNNWKLIIGTSVNPTYDNYFGESGKLNTRGVPYNTSEIASSLVARAISTLNVVPTSPIEYERLREQAKLNCLSDKEDKNPPSCNPEVPGTGCLYDMSSDPCEEHDLSNLFPYVVRRMKKTLVEYRSGLIPQLNQPEEPSLADPKLFNYTFRPWRD